MKPIKAFASILVGLILGLGAALSYDANAVLKAVAGITSPSGIFTAEGGEDSLTAFAGGGQGSATALSASVVNHRVTTVATAADSVKLPAATVGARHYVRNDGAAAMQVFGQATETINGVASATGISQGVGMGVWYECTTAGAWTTTPVSTITATTAFRVPDGLVGTPGVAFTSESNTGIYRSASGTLDISLAGTRSYVYHNSGFYLLSNTLPIWMGASSDTTIARAAANSLQFGAGTTTAGAATARTELNKSVASIADATPTSVLTITVPNAAHSASVQVRLTCSLGAGGAIGANEATATNTYVIALTRTAGVNATAAISTAFGAAATAVAGAATVTATAAMSAVSGAVGATNTFTVNATVTRSGGASTNHTCLVYAQEMNANATGITIL